MWNLKKTKHWFVFFFFFFKELMFITYFCAEVHIWSPVSKMYFIAVLHLKSPLCLQIVLIHLKQRVKRHEDVREWLNSSWRQNCCPAGPEKGHQVGVKMYLHHGRYVLITSLMGLRQIGQHALICLFSFNPQSLHRHMCPQV